MIKQLNDGLVMLDTYGEGYSILTVCKEIQNLPADTKRFVVFCPREHTPVSTGDMSGIVSDTQMNRKLAEARDYADENGIQLELVIGRFKYPEYPVLTYQGKKPIRWNDVFSRLFHIVHHLSDWWFKESTYMYCGTHHNKLPFPVPYEQLDYICAVRNYNAHPHRSATMDILAKYDLLNPTCSWRMLSKDYCEYNFLHWHEKLMMVEEHQFDPDLPEEHHSIYTSIHEGAMNSLVEIITESTVEYSFFTEKTTKWLLYGKAFVIVGAPGMHAHLANNLGFELYDELFDYSFDSIMDTRERIEAIAKQLKQLDEDHPTPEDKQKLLELIKPKLRRNFDHLVSIVNQDYSSSLTPVLDTFEFYESVEYAREYLSAMQSQ